MEKRRPKACMHAVRNGISYLLISLMYVFCLQSYENFSIIRASKALNLQNKLPFVTESCSLSQKRVETATFHFIASSNWQIIQKGTDMKKLSLKMMAFMAVGYR